ncbi:hypothetical protein CBR_g26006 [Chara braunii]|uniref:Reverse transcriptase domain-containing protein n=1 Tax=Chara braunii TaxID=69332 RepID=A0A388L6Z0_CHABU|nr:hypothetical protein CBR_g26006 [Chara braunii]|eukprot:GBG78069.1 hypothetical protein CBR_g26006 [Chara braunii]
MRRWLVSASIRDWPRPQTVTEVRYFSGMCDYYRNFAKNYSTVASPLTDLTRLDTPWDWSDECEAAFKRLKHALMNHEVLMVPDPQKPFIVTTYASQYNIGAVLTQQDGKKLRRIEYMSKKMPPKKPAKSTYERELYALYKALVHWRHFLLGRFFYLRTGHQTLKWIKPQLALSDALKRWIEVIDQYAFKLEYLKGEYNKVADALSRRADYLGALVSEFGVSEELTQSLVGAYQENLVTMDIIHKFQAKDKATEDEFVMVDELLFLDKAGFKRMSLAELEELRKQLETLTSKGWIRPSTSKFSARVLFVPKGNDEFRMCIDYRGLNKITRKSTEPLPRIDDLLDMVQGCTVFSKVDLKSGNHQIEMAEEDVYKTTFKTRYGTYEFLVMPFRLCNAPGTFQTEMDRIFRPYLDKFMVVYLDDIQVFSKTVREHAEHLALVLQSLRDSQYKINREKSSFGVPYVIYLDHVISGDGLAPKAAKIAAIQEWPQPQTVRDVRSFMGLASYYRKFVMNFSAVVVPLTNLTKKDTPFLWSLHFQLTFTRLKKALTRVPVLKLPDPTLPFILTIDASQYGIGAVLQQDDGNGLRPVEFMSKKIKTQKLQDSTYKKELYALALKHWKHFLLGRYFKIFSDHSTLQWMKSQGELNDKLARYIQFIDMFDFELKHKKGCYNKVADAVSRRPDSFALISSTHSFGEETRQTIARLLPQDETFGPMVRNLQADPNSEPGYALSSDLLYTCSRGEERLCIPQDQRLRTLLMSECHDARGHFGFLKSYATLSQHFFWKEMRSDMLRYVDTYELCQRNKVQRRPPLGLLKPLPIPDGPAESVSIDFTDLGKTTPRGMHQVMVCVDRFSKYAEFIPLPEVARVPAVRPAFSERFCIDEWQSYWKDYLHSRLDMTSGHYLEANGLAEVMNQVLFQLLRPVISPDQQDWDLHLARAQLMYNMSVHSTNGFIPYWLHWGREPRQPLDDIIDKAKPDLTPGTTEFAKRYRLDVERARANLFKAQKAMIEQANRHRRPSPIRTGDHVWVASFELSREEDISPKLLPRYLGPWQVLYTVGADPFGPSYVIDVPLHLHTYPVFHASKVLPFTPADAFLDRPPEFGPPIPSKGYDVEWIEDEWGAGPDRQYLVRFAFQPPSENNWFYRRELLKTAKLVVLRYEAAQKGNLPGRSPRLRP